MVLFLYVCSTDLVSLAAVLIAAFAVLAALVLVFARLVLAGILKVFYIIEGSSYVIQN